MTKQEYCTLFLYYNLINQSIKLDWIYSNRELFAKLVDIQNSHSHTALHFASMNAHTEIVKLLLEANASVDVTTSLGRTALHFVSINGYPEIVKLLLDANASVDVTDRNGRTSLHLASLNGHTDIVKLLLDATLYE